MGSHMMGEHLILSLSPVDVIDRSIFVIDKFKLPTDKHAFYPTYQTDNHLAHVKSVCRNTDLIRYQHCTSAYELLFESSENLCAIHHLPLGSKLLNCSTFATRLEEARKFEASESWDSGESEPAFVFERGQVVANKAQTLSVYSICPCSYCRIS